MSCQTIMVKVVDQAQGEKKRNEVLEALANGCTLSHAAFRHFNDDTCGLFLVFSKPANSDKHRTEVKE